jgi:hypothetical protein
MFVPCLYPPTFVAEHMNNNVIKLHLRRALLSGFCQPWPTASASGAPKPSVAAFALSLMKEKYWEVDRLVAKG